MKAEKSLATYRKLRTQPLWRLLAADNSPIEVCKFPADNMKQIIEEVLDQMDLALEKVANRLPVSFPMGIFVAISTQMQTLRNHATITKETVILSV